MCQGRPKPGTSVGAGQSQQPLREQGQDTDLCGSRPETRTFPGTRLEPETSTRAGLSQGPPLEQVQGNKGTGLPQRLLWDPA